MIRQVKHNNKDYFVIHTDIHIMSGDHDIIIVPTTIQVNITGVEIKKQFIVYNKIKSLFNRDIILGGKKSLPPPSKPWWKFW